MKPLLLIAFFTFSISSFAQTGKIEGKVTDSRSGAILSGVSVSMDGDKAIASSNVDGYFVITVAAGKKYTIKLTSVGYQSKEITDIEVAAGQVTHLEILIDKSTKTEDAVMVTASARKESAAALITYQKNTAVVAQVVSAETIRRSPDKNTGDVLKRVPGASLQQGKYLIVRGLADRYNQAMLNGVLLSSTEPDRKTFSFDIIPSNLVDNIIINKSFIPELPGEWAGGLIQVNTKDVPAKNFFNVQIGTGFNTATIGKDFYAYEGSSTDWLGYDNGKRALPDNLPKKADFAQLDAQAKTAFGSGFENIWGLNKKSSTVTPGLNQSVAFNFGFNKKLGSKNKFAAVFAVNYNKSGKRLVYQNLLNTFQNNVPSTSFDYNDNTKYSQDVLAGALANLTLQLGNNSKISFKNILNVNTTNYATTRSGYDYDAGEQIKSTELAFKANTFFNTQLTGDHNIKKYKAKFHWFGSFNILDQYIPDQRRLEYIKADPANPDGYIANIGASNSSQKSGSRYYGFLNDYVYTAGADLSKDFQIGKLTQSVKGGYFFQVKDRLFDSRPFSIYMPVQNLSLLRLSPDQIFASQNFGNGTDNKFAFNELSASIYRYLANSILNAGFLQFDNQITDKIRVVWGVRVEDFDQLIGSVKKSDPRHLHTEVRDYLPGLNATYKLNNKTNIRLSGSQTVVRPEFRELSSFAFYDFDLGASVQGNTALQRTKVTNFDLRYELYPRGGELITFGVFYKYFNKPIEAYFNASSGGASTYNYVNADEANSFGAELEFRKKLDFSRALHNFTVQGNFSYIYNRVTSSTNPISRPMQGQSPYLLNLGLQYDVEKYGLTTTLLFNQIGRRIGFVGGGIDLDRTPDTWENPRPVLDFQIAKKVLKTRGEVKLNVSDIFNKQAIFYQDLNGSKKYDDGDAYFFKRKYGTNFSFTFGYNF